MTIHIDSVWVLFGVAIILGAGLYLGVLYMILIVSAGKKLGVLLADWIVIPVVNKAAGWRKAWKK